MDSTPYLGFLFSNSPRSSGADVSHQDLREADLSIAAGHGNARSSPSSAVHPARVNAVRHLLLKGAQSVTPESEVQCGYGLRSLR